MKSPLNRAREILGTGRLGRWALAKAVTWSAPFFLSIRPRFAVFEPGHVEVLLRKRWGVTNHIGTVHAIAMCNAAEFAAGTCCELTVPGQLRWIPVGMTVEYLALAKTDLRAVCVIEPAVLSEVGDAVLLVELFDTDEQLVFTARITMRVSERKARAKAA